MTPIGHHIRLRLLDSRVIAPTPLQQRLVARVVPLQGRRYNLIAMDLAEWHLHLGALCNRALAGRFAHGVEASLKQRLGLPVGFMQYSPEPIRDNRHLHNAFKYILTQHQRPGFARDPLYEASNALDLLGLRIWGRYTLSNVRQWLPMLRYDELLEWLGWPRPEPADGPLAKLESATLAAACLDNLRSRRPLVVAARRAMLEIIGERLSRKETAELLGLKVRTLRWLKTQPVDQTLVRAIRLQLGYRSLTRDIPPNSW